MKKFTLLLVLMVLTALNVQSQTVLCSNNFDSYTVGSYMAVQDPTWFRTWSNAPGTGEDALISNAFSKSPTKSVLCDDAGSPTDLLLKLGDKTTGTYELKWMMYVESDKAGYYNIQHFQTPENLPNEYAMQVFFQTSGSALLDVGGVRFQFSYPKDTWFEVKHLIDLDANDIKYYVKGVLVMEWPFNYQAFSTSGTKQLGGVDFYAGPMPSSADILKYFFDDLSFKELPVTNSLSPDWFWAKSFGGTWNDGGISSVDASGNVYTAGGFTGTVDFDPGVGIFNLTPAGGNDIFITKMDAMGNFVWAKQIGGIGNETAISAIAVDESGNVFTTGYFTATVDFDPSAGTFNLTPTGSEDTYISKLDNQGNFVWAKSFGGTIDAIVEGNSITFDTSGNVFTAGVFAGTIDFDPGTATLDITSAGDYDIFISKSDSSGNFVWAKSMGGSSAGASANDIAADVSGNVYTTCSFTGTVDFNPGLGVFNLTSQVGQYTGVISKLDASGSFVWAKQIDGVDIPSLVLDVSGNVYVTGTFTATVDFDPGVGIFNLSSAGDKDIFISKLDNSGDFVWAKAMGGPGLDWCQSIALDAEGFIYNVGEFKETADFDPGPETFSLTSVGGFDIFVSKLDKLGNFVWAKASGGAFNDWGQSIAIDALGNVYAAGSFMSPSILFDSFTIINHNNTGNSTDAFVARIGVLVTGIKSVKNDWDITVYPNPTNGKFTISSNSNPSAIEIYNLSGARVYSDFNSKKQTTKEIDLSGYAKGIYLVKIYDGTKIQSRKVIVQ